MIYDLPMAQLALASIALIVVVEGNVGAVTPASVHVAVAAASAQFSGVRLLSEEEMFVGDDDATRGGALECGADAACLAGILRRFNARFGLIAAVLDARDGPGLIVLRLIDAEKGSAVAVDSGALPADGDVARAISERTARVLESAGFRVSPVRVSVAPIEVQVEEKSIVESPWLWIGVAGAAISAASIAVFVVTRSSSQCICFETSDGACPGC